MIRVFLDQAVERLDKISDSPQLDAELLLAYALKKPRSYLYAHVDDLLPQSVVEPFNQLIKQRLTGMPIAYILKKKEFWSVEFLVNQHTLIPRPETELLVDAVLKAYPADFSNSSHDSPPCFLQAKINVADLGTGCGAIALALASERPLWQIVGVDIDEQALEVARQNGVKLGYSQAGSRVQFLLGRWCEPLPNIPFNVIVSNPPYIAEGDPELDDSSTQHEPRSALISGEDGLEAIREIIDQAGDYLVGGGMLALEHGYRQSAAVAELLGAKGYGEIVCLQDIAGRDRVTIARWLGG